MMIFLVALQFHLEFGSDLCTLPLMTWGTRGGKIVLDEIGDHMVSDVVHYGLHLFFLPLSSMLFELFRNM